LLTARGEVDDRIEGLETGADDYVHKPFEPRELVLRINSILRRVPKPVSTKSGLKLGAWLYLPERDELKRGDEVFASLIWRPVSCGFWRPGKVQR